VPHRREARLNSEIFWVVDEETFEILRGLCVSGMARRITQGTQRDERVQHCRKNGREPVAPLADPFQHPALGFLERAFAHRTPAESRNDLEPVIGAQEKIPPGEETRVAWGREILVLGAERIQLVELLHPW